MFHGLIIILTLLGAAPPVESIFLRFIGNAGFEITDGTNTILIDFPYESGAYGYMTFESDELHERPDSLCIFTHAHADHFSAEQLTGVGCTVAGPSAVMAQSGQSARLEGGSPWQFGSATITCIPSQHGDVEHCSYVLNWNDKVIFVAGDVEAVEPVIRQVTEADVLILPYWVSEEVAAIQGRFPAARIILSHQEPGGTSSLCAGCLQLEQGETMVP
jgi:L-ascorbate metabolism protein UlaG (beta-lactamase superfamily)